ncbi:MAG: hypothetical protein JO168_08235 [Solirubrobacterales bacterium]|nr:hypothetical protein [Solirubrobacterales bacterium]MBV9717387.1 hypothetical protein [Solirubrobacterales bacterium]
MSTGTTSGADHASAEERAEELMERIFSEGSRRLGKLFGRIREEVEDIVAEGRVIHDQSREQNRK